jgi:DNA-binding response OmpR family regulator
VPQRDQRPAATILVIDDTPGVVDILVTVLREEGYEVFGARTGEEGLQLFTLSRPDLVLLDISLPDTNGLELLARIRSISPMARVVMMSGAADSERVRRAFKAGALACVDKPFNLADLKQVIAAALRPTAERGTSR